MLRLTSLATGCLLLLVGTGLGAAERSRPKAPPPPPPREIRSRELMAEREGLKLRLYEKWRVGYEESWKQNGNVILLVHGATWASRCTFDPDPERGYSLMEVLADAGFDTFAVDLHGYGKSERREDDWTDAQAAVKDIEAAVEFIRSFRWVERVHLFGYQWGAQPVALYAMFKPQKVGKMVLLGMRWKQVEYSGAAPTVPVRTLGQQAALLKPEDGDLDSDFVRRRAQVCRAESAQAPNGALRDLSRPSLVDPTKIRVPVLLIQGERDGSAEALADRLAFFRELGSRDKWYVVLRGMGKYAPIEREHTRFDQALLSFLTQL
ncbi:MAG: alpha/beta fold hydrolase [Myxococcales bacterium]|nr:lysophospholipase [Myxococcota bacterium]MDW8282865.1 alpha/beta fold hydrolase [Myxococcales bacterium]